MVRGVNPFEEKSDKQGRIRVSAKEDRTIDGVVFASKWEARCYKEFRDAFKPGAFTLQPRIELVPKFVGPDGEKVRNVEYRGDFIFGPERKSPSSPLTQDHTLIDAKGMEDPVFKLKSKLLRYKFARPIILVKRVKDLRALIEVLGKKYPKLVRQ
jgi:hypothetical protein